MNRKIYLFLLLCLVLVNCSNPNHSENKDKTEKPIDKKNGIKICRFDQDILALAKDSSLNTLHRIRDKYGYFLDTIFCKQIMKISAREDEYLITNLINFMNDVDIQRIYKEVVTQFKNMDQEEMQFKAAFDHYKTLFPNNFIPKVYTMINAFNYSAIAIDSAVVIGLELYLGGDCPFYSSLQYPSYRMRKLSKEYMVRDAMECWLKSDYDNANMKHDLMNQIIYNGKILYALDALLPELNDTIKTGFTKKQLDWCVASEGAIWTFFIEKKLLFSTNEKQYESFINEGPTSKGMPRESPSNAGSWIGWQIVKKYMKEHPELSIKQLLETQDAQKILSGSRYKPSV